MSNLKTCKKCNIEKEIIHFEFRKDTLKYRNICRKCSKGYLETRLEKIKDIESLLKDNLKKCSKCNQIKNIVCFNNDKLTITGKTSCCKECIKNKYTPLELKNIAYKSKYNLTLAEYNQLFENQFGKCYICNTKTKKLVVDHCHTTGKIRGLLCNHCNSGLGFFKDNTEYLMKACEYLNNNN